MPLASVVLRHRLSIGTALYVVGVLWHALFPLVNVSGGGRPPRGVHVSEHAVQTGAADAAFAPSHAAAAAELSDEFVAAGVRDCAGAAAWFAGVASARGLRVHTVPDLRAAWAGGVTVVATVPARAGGGGGDGDAIDRKSVV